MAALVVLAAFGLLGAGTAMIRHARVRGSPLAELDGRLVRVEGVLVSDPEARTAGWSAELRARHVVPLIVRSVGAVRVPERIWLQGDGRPPEAMSGEPVTVDGRLSLPSGPFGPYLSSRGFAAVLRAERFTARGPPENVVIHTANALRSALGDALLVALGDRNGGLVMGLALGDTSRLDPALEEDFRASGLSHLTAVSGANVAMFLAPVLAVASLLGLRTRGRVAVGVAAVAFFVVLTRAEPSVLRAGVMAGLGLLGVLLGRPRSPPAILSGSVLVLTGADPGLVHAIGFQLSVAATAGMALLAAPVATRLRFLPEPVALAAGATLGAQVGVFPLILFHFGAMPTTALPANLLAFPAVGPGMVLGLVAGAGALVAPAAGRAIGVVAAIPLGYLRGVADRLALAPLPTVTSETGRVTKLVLGLALVAATCWWIRSGRGVPRRAVVALAVAMPAFLLAHALRVGPPDALTVTFFDVGQGDAALVRSPGGAQILVDGGPEPDGAAVELAARGIRRLDVLVATHPHADHLAGLPAVLARFPVGLALDPGCGGESPFHADFTRAVRAAGVRLHHPRAGERLHVGDVVIEVLGPASCYRGTESDANNDSLVLRIDFGGRAAVLFPGDAEEPAQEDLLEEDAGSLRAPVLKVPHHGGATSAEGFFEAVDSAVAVVSTGPNTYGHPVPEVLRSLVAHGMRVLRTDLLGDVTVTFDGRGLLIQSQRA